MKTIISITVSAFLGLSLAGCPEASTDTASPAPEKFNELIIEYYDGGGMLPHSQEIYICADSAYSEVYDFGDKNRVNWIPKESDLISLYEVLKTNKFDKIEAEADRGEVYDRGGPVIDITVDGKRYQLNNHGNSFIKAEWREEFNAIEKAILETAPPVKSRN